jgi:hypothetical protein
MVQLIFEAAQGVLAGAYLDTYRQAERSDLQREAHPCRTEGFSEAAALARFVRARAQTNRAALLIQENPICHFIVVT